MSDNVTPITAAKDGSKPRRPRRPKAPEHDFAKLTFRTDATDANVSAVLEALFHQFEQIKETIDGDTVGDMKASYLALGGAAIVQGLIERLETEEGP